MNYAGNLPQHAGKPAVHGRQPKTWTSSAKRVANKDNRIFDHQYYDGPYDKNRSTPRAR